VLAPGQEGGLERVVAMLADGQRGRGVHVAAVLTPDRADDHPFVEGLRAVGIPVTSLVVGGRNYVSEYRRLAVLVKRLSPGVVHTHGYRADVIGGAVARSLGVPTVSTIHGFTGTGWRNRVYEAVQCIALRRADAVIAVSRPLVHRLVGSGVPRERIHCVPNSFAPPAYILERSAARQKLGLGVDACVAAWVGRLSKEKGPDVMLEAISHCDPSWQLSVIGDGPERDRLRQQAARLGIADRVSWHGLVSNAGSLLAAFDAFVLSSRTEGTPIALFEAMHAGVPVIATRVGGVPDVIASTHALLVPPEDPRMIAQALEEIARGPSSAAQRSILARARLRDAFGSAGWISSVDAIYDGVRNSYEHPPVRIPRRSQARAESGVRRV